MRTFPNFNEFGDLVSFRVESWRAGPTVIASLVKRKLGVEISNFRYVFSHEDIHFHFKYQNCDFTVSDSLTKDSEYTISPAKNLKVEPKIIEKIENAFKSFRPGIFGMFSGFLRI